MTADDGGELLIGPRHLLAQIQHGNDLGFADQTCDVGSYSPQTSPRPTA